MLPFFFNFRQWKTKRNQFLKARSRMSNFLIAIWLSFLRFTLTFLHFAYTVYEYLDSAWSSLRRKLVNLTQLQYSDTQSFVSRFVSKLDKCPFHFAVIVGKDGLDVEDFSNLVAWCLAANISFVSFYDHTGYLKANEKIYYKYLIDKRKLDPRCLIYNLEKPNYVNGVLHKIHLNILSLEDGKPLLVDVAKNLSLKVVLNELKVNDINERLINEELFRLSGIPEPDLGIICGTTCSTFGFLPWHVRVTEFLQVKNIKGIQVTEFTSLLNKYSSCEQRFGK